MDFGHGALRRAWQGTGLLLVLAVIAFGVAAAIHHASVLPSKYTWFEPLRTLKDIASLPWSPTVIVGAFLIGRWRRRSEWAIEKLASTQQLDLRAVLRTPRAKRIAAVSLMLLLVGVLAFPLHNAFDRLAFVVAGFVVGWPEHRRQIGRLVLEILFATFVFLAICYCYTVLKALTFVDTKQVDLKLLNAEHALLGVYPHKVIAAWSATKPWLVKLCDWVYFKFFLHMALTTALLLGMHRSRERVEYLGALALCYLLGGPLYHVLPGAGPVFFDPSSYAHVKHMPLMTNGVRDWLFANTGGVVTHKATVVKTWGYIACMPSLHIAQEVVMLWYARRSRVAFLLSAVFTGTTCLAVVVLGWHYPIDVVGGIVVAAIAIAIAHWQRDTLFPARVMPPPDAELPPRPRLGELIGRFRRAQVGEVTKASDA